MTDERIKILAEKLVGYSVAAKKNDKVLVEAFDVETPLIEEIIKNIYKVGAIPFVDVYSNKIQRRLLMQADENTVTAWTKYAKAKMQDMDCYIGVRGGYNSYELSDVPSEKQELYSRIYGHVVHHEIRVPKTRWVVLRYPNDSMSQLSGMSTEAFEDYYFSVCNLDYSLMNDRMTPLKTIMEKTDRVRIVANGTDLTFSIKDMPAVKCAGNYNIPDGEIYTAPLKNSVNGVITYNTPSIHSGLKFENVKLVFKNGKIIESSANYDDKLREILDTDEGARYVGEFALGVNPMITKPMGDILFDEKIAGSVHFTPGCCYEDAYNGNISALHWDLVQIHTPEYGGGEIYFDDVLIRKDGKFILPELQGLNPENLK